MGTLTVAVAGSSGLIGSALVSALRADNQHVLRLVRRAPAGAGELRWDPEAGDIDADALAGVDAVVNLCGISLADRRWSGAFKQNLRDSRITPTEVLSAAVAAAGVPLLINASAVGYYGDSGSRTIDESAPNGRGFLAQLTQDWENATTSARLAGARVVLARTGQVVARSGGVVAGLRPLFWLGLGSRLGNGRQYMSWISLRDEVRALLFALTEPSISGPVNLTGPAPVTNAEFTAALGRALNRPAALLLPGLLARAALGELAEEAMLSGQRAIPAALEQAGFTFQHNTIGEALAYATAAPTPL